MNIIKAIYTSILLLVVSSTMAQSKEKIDLNEGVSLYQSGKYDDAQRKFEQAYAQNNSYTKGIYNAANAAYLAGRFDTAMVLYDKFISQTTSKNGIAKAHYNIGNAHLQKAKVLERDPQKASEAQTIYKSAIKSYKESLKNNPSDPQTKYNLTYALNKLQQNINQQESKKEDDKKEDESSKDKEEKDKEGDPKNDEKKDDPKKDGEGDKPSDDKKNDPKDPKNSKDGQQPTPQKPIDGKISKEQAEKDLDAINADESKILNKVYQKKSDKKAPQSSSKDW